MLSNSGGNTVKHSSALDGLPKSFLHVLKTLFDILDDEGTGLVKFTDIEKRWQDNGTGSDGVPKGVIESLRKVTPPNGLLSFERYCAGLKICLLRNQMETRNKKMDRSGGGGGGGGGEAPTKHLSARPPSAPILETFDSKSNSNEEKQWNKNTMNSTSQFVTNSVRQNQLRTLSMPHLPPDNSGKEDAKENFLNKHSTNGGGGGILLGPPKPPRSNVIPFTSVRTTDDVTSRTDKAEIRAALQNWQLGLLYDDKYSAASYRTVPSSRSVADGVSDYTDPQTHKKCFPKRREPRRHTLQNGIDSNMFKKMKHVETEKEVLLEGLQAVERAREWYRKQLAVVQDKMKYACRMGSHDQWSETQQDRVELLRARILEINRHLATLGGNSGDSNKTNNRDGLPLHMNLAVHSSSHLSHMQLLSQLKRQNHLLSGEIGHKTEKINTLEREKAALLRELYQTRRKSDQPICKPSTNGENIAPAPPAYI